MTATRRDLRTILVENDINPNHLFEILKQGIEVEMLSAEAKVVMDDTSFVKSHAKIRQTEKFLSILSCLSF
jgi:hypothetical protein